MTEEIIHIKPIRLRNQKPSDDGQIRLELHEKYIFYYVKFYASEPKDTEDQTLGWETVYNNYETIVSKTAIVGIDKSYMSEGNNWSLYIFVSGMAGDVKLYFKKESEAQEVFDKLFKYLYD